MSGWKRGCAWGLVAALMVAIAAGPVHGQDATTAGDPAVNMTELDLLLLPLTQDQLGVEAEAWFALLRTQVKTMADLEIVSRTGEGEAKSTAIAELTGQRATQTALTDRFKRVLTAFEAKGGDAATYTKYVTAVSGIRVDVTDPNAVWTTLSGWATSKEGGIRWAKNIGLAIGTVIVFWILAGILGGLVSRTLMKLRQTPEMLRSFFVNITRKLTLVVGLVVAVSMLEVNIGPLVAAIGAAGFIVGFALQGTLSNFASGIMILLYRPFDVGDFVKVAGIAGTVHSMSIVSTSIRTPDNQTVVVPNSSIWGDVITNVTTNDTRRVDMVFGIGYGDDIEKAIRVLTEIVRSHKLVFDDPEPMIQVSELADSSVNFVVRPWCKTSDYWDVFFDVTRTVKERFDAEGISIPFPQRDVHVMQEPMATA